MGKILVLTEKPSVAREIARVLNCKQNGNGFISGSQYIITWALGHLVTLADPETYSEQYKTWRLEDLPMLPKHMQLVVIKQTSKQFSVVKNLLKQNDIDSLVIATDAGREGELVARWIIQKAGFRKPIKRLWISSQTDRAIKEGFSKLKSSRDYDQLYLSAQCRAEADWLVGLNVTRALTCKYNAQLSAGRVQTPTLAMVVARETEIRNFMPKDYWTISSKLNQYSIQWRDKNNQTRITDKSKAEAIAAKVKGQMGEVVEVSQAAKQELPPLLYDLTELQRDANRKYGFSAKKTLSVMQKLYEAHKLVTYPRTDSRYISDDIVPSLTERIKSIAVGPYSKLAGGVLRNKYKVTKRLVDNSKVTDHHAIIPTEQYVNLGSLNSEERNIYDLIVKRFLAALKEPFEYQQTTVKIDVKGEAFFAKGKVITRMGWKEAYEGRTDSDDEDEYGNDNSDEQKDQSLPQIKKGEKVKLDVVNLNNGKTKPPARYNEATLLSAMEHPGKFIENDALRQTLDNTSGLGTPATRADIIEKLFDSFYLERRGKEIIPTSKGTQLVDLVPEDLKSPELTAKWEQQLTLISKGKANAEKYVEDIKTYASKMVSNVISSTDKYRHDNMTREKCPECGKYLLEVKGKKGMMLVCQDRECGYRKGLSQISNARCPECHKKLLLSGDGDNKIFTCACGYREKMEAFKKRKNEEGDRVNKREVSNFLRKQSKDSNEPMNSALADALAKWKG